MDSFKPRDVFKNDIALNIVSIMFLKPHFIYRAKPENIKIAYSKLVTPPISAHQMKEPDSCNTYMITLQINFNLRMLHMQSSELSVFII